MGIFALQYIEYLHMYLYAIIVHLGRVFLQGWINLQVIIVNARFFLKTKSKTLLCSLPNVV